MLDSVSQKPLTVTLKPDTGNTEIHAKIHNDDEGRLSKPQILFYQTVTVVLLISPQL